MNYSLLFFAFFTVSSLQSAQHARDMNKELLYQLTHSNVDEVRRLLKTGANANTRDIQGYSPLHYALGFRGAALVELLLAHGADAKVIRGGWTLFHYLQQGYTEYNTFHQTRYGMTANYYHRNYEKIGKLLIAHGVDLNAQDDHGATALMYAAQYRFANPLWEITRFAFKGSAIRLLIMLGADDRIKNAEKGNRTALDFAQDKKKISYHIESAKQERLRQNYEIELSTKIDLLTKEDAAHRAENEDIVQVSIALKHVTT
jgi:ankyrin repeat protein